MCKHWPCVTHHQPLCLAGASLRLRERVRGEREKRDREREREKRDVRVERRCRREDERGGRLGETHLTIEREPETSSSLLSPRVFSFSSTLLSIPLSAFNLPTHPEVTESRDQKRTLRDSQQHYQNLQLKTQMLHRNTPYILCLFTTLVCVDILALFTLPCIDLNMDPVISLLNTKEKI